MTTRMLINNISKKIDKIREEFEADKNNLSPDVLKTKYLGRKSEINELFENLKKHREASIRKEIGKQINELKGYIEKNIESIALTQRRDKNKSSILIDYSEPSIKSYIGHLHPITQVMLDVIEVFSYFGFEYVESPEIETDWYCFGALNMPPEHPARDMQDTFYINEEKSILPRTHTSAAQVRYGETHRPPFRMLVTGRVYRNEAIDLRHTFMFHQLEGLMVDDKTTVTDCKNMITEIIQKLLRSPKISVRFRHAFFPYTEPSFEIDGTCPNCLGAKCNLCSNKGWVELGGLGMVHPQVLRNMNIDPNVYQGFALGFGAERIAMLRHDIKYLPVFFENDLRFLRQF